MNTKRKSFGAKASTRVAKERDRRVAATAFVVFTLLVISASAYYVHTIQNQLQDQDVSPASRYKAAIVDHLSLTCPNQDFADAATNILGLAGYTVDYYSSPEVTVEFYRNLPTCGYKLVILRVHSMAAKGSAALFTSEPYNPTKYVQEQLADQLVCMAFSLEEAERGVTYFGIGPRFVTQSMKGSFQNTTIIIMGCEGLNNTKMAEAFVEKGARVCIGWSGPVSASQTDAATKQLLQYLLIERDTIREAINRVLVDAGNPDAGYANTLTFYPSKGQSYNVERQD